MPMQFHFEDRGPHHGEERVGHHFLLSIVLGQRRGARLAWFERTDRPDSANPQQDTWLDLHPLHGGSAPLYQQWLETAGDKGRVEIDFHAFPSMRREPYAQRTLEWCVVVVDGEDENEDDGARDWAMWRGVQRLSCDALGNAVGQSLTAYPAQHGRSDQPPHPDDWPHY